MLRIRGLLSNEELEEVDRLLEAGNFVDGLSSAGASGQLIKSNLEMDPQDPNGLAAGQIIQQAISKNQEFVDYAMPFKTTGILFNRYPQGAYYGDHNDNVVNYGPQLVIRADVSFTIFLSSPDEYEGGDLILNVMGQELSVKYDRGDMVIYPSGHIHRVNEVKSGCRNAAVCFVQSTIPQHEQREIVRTIRQVRSDILLRDGRSKQYEQVDYVFTNLQRMWLQV
jgi:PKHD-type hydroxylase